MRDTILLFESRDLCYESNRYFIGCMEEAFEHAGYLVEVCDLSQQMETQLKGILERQEKFVAAFDFNSLLPRIELEDGTPYLSVFQVPFFNYLVDHPLYHHASLVQEFPCYFVLCIDQYHQRYIETYYPHIKGVFYLPLGGMRAGIERSFDQKRLELLFLGTYYPEDKLYQEILEYPAAKKREVLNLIERMDADQELTQEQAMAQYLHERQEKLSKEAFAERMNQAYLADKYLRNVRRCRTALAAAESGVPFTIVGHGWESVKGLEKKHIHLQAGVGFAASIQVMADAKMLLNCTPGFCGGLHDRVYTAMMNHTLCFTEKSRFAEQTLMDGKEAALYDSSRLDMLPEQILAMYENPEAVKDIAQRAWKRAVSQESWQQRIDDCLNRISGKCLAAKG